MPYTGYSKPSSIYAVYRIAKIPRYAYSNTYYMYLLYNGTELPSKLLHILGLEEVNRCSESS
jgi:hypothetical protein